MNCYMTKMLKGISENLDDKEVIVLTALKDLYSSKHEFLLVTVNGIAYKLTKKFLNKSVKTDRVMFQNIKDSIQSLAEKEIIIILDQDEDAEHYVISRKGLEVDTEKEYEH